MSAREAFGPNLRRLRLQRGVSLEDIARTTNVSVALWAGLERNDFSRWPTGIYARSYLRDYARAIAEDPESIVDEFCRCFPEGDRRLGQIAREHAAIVGHVSAWRDEIPATLAEGDRRAAPPAHAPPAAASRMLVHMRVLLRRAFGRA